MKIKTSSGIVWKRLCWVQDKQGNQDRKAKIMKI